MRKPNSAELDAFVVWARSCQVCGEDHPCRKTMFTQTWAHERDGHFLRRNSNEDIAALVEQYRSTT